MCMKLDAKLTNQASVTASQPDFHTTCIHQSGMLLWRRNARLCFLRGFSASADDLIRMFNPLSGDDRRGSSRSTALSGASARALLPGLVGVGTAVDGGSGGRSAACTRGASAIAAARATTCTLAHYFFCRMQSRRLTHG